MNPSSYSRILAIILVFAAQIAIPTGLLGAEYPKLLKEHLATVSAVAWSPDGSVLASSGTDATIRLWDATTGKELHCIVPRQTSPSKPGVNAIEKVTMAEAVAEVKRLYPKMSRDEVQAAAAKQVKLNEFLHEAGGYGSPGRLAFSPSGDRLAVALRGDDIQIGICDVESGEVLKTLDLFRYDEEIAKVIATSDDAFGNGVAGGGALANAYVTYSPDSQYLTTTDSFSRIRTWNAKHEVLGTVPGLSKAELGGGPVVLSGIGYLKQQKAGARDGAGRLVSAASSGRISIWKPGAAAKEAHRDFSFDGLKLAKGEKPARHPERAFIYDVAVSSDGKTIALGCANEVLRLWRQPWKEPFQVINIPDSIQPVPAFSLDGTFVAVGAGRGRLYLIDVEAGKIVKTIVHGDRMISAAAFHPDGSKLASGSWDGSLLISDISDVLPQAGKRTRP